MLSSVALAALAALAVTSAQTIAEQRSTLEAQQSSLNAQLSSLNAQQPVQQPRRDLGPSSPEMSATNQDLHLRLPRQGDMRVTRQVEVNVGERLANIESTLIPSILATAQIDAREAAFNATLTVFNGMNGRMDRLSESLEARIATSEATVTSQMAEIRAASSVQAVALQQAITATLGSATQSIATAMAAAETSQSTAMAAAETSLGASSLSLARQLTRTEAALDTTISQALVSVQSSITLMNVTVNTGLAGKADAAVHMWTGGCANSANSGWQEYCLNQAHVDTARPFFMKHTNTRFRALQDGYFAINYWVAYRACNWAYHCILVNGQNKVHGYQRSGAHEGGNSWRDVHQHLLFPIQSGWQFWGRTYSGCWSAYHSTNVRGEHSRITALYQGVWNR